MLSFSAVARSLIEHVQGKGSVWHPVCCFQIFTFYQYNREDFVSKISVILFQNSLMTKSFQKIASIRIFFSSPNLFIYSLIFLFSFLVQSSDSYFSCNIFYIRCTSPSSFLNCLAVSSINFLFIYSSSYLHNQKVTLFQNFLYLKSFYQHLQGHLQIFECRRVCNSKVEKIFFEKNSHFRCQPYSQTFFSMSALDIRQRQLQIIILFIKSKKQEDFFRQMSKLYQITRNCCLNILNIYYKSQNMKYSENTNIFGSQFSLRNILYSILIIATFLPQVYSETVFKVYPLADQYFQKIYLVKQQNRQHYLTISCKQQNTLSISISDQKVFEEAPRFNIYGNLLNKPKMGKNVYTFMRECPFYVDVNTNNFLEVKRTKDSESIFTLNSINFANLHNSFKVEDKSVKWGLGQRFQSNFRLTNGKWTIWNRDKPWKIDKGMLGLSDQTYGHQPVYLARERQSKLYHLVYFKNTFGLLIEANQNGDQLVYNSVGGNIQFIIIIGQSDPEGVLETYHDYIGASHIPPFWSLGYHQCRWGYQNADVLLSVVNKFKENDLPIDTIWSDLDYMDQKMIFTVNPITHGGNRLNSMIKQQQIHFVPLIDVGVSTRDQTAMNVGKALDVFLKSPHQKDTYYTGQVWPGQVHFVDFHHPKAFNFWKNQLRRLYDQVQFSGIWLDMNEPSNFRGNEPTTETYRIQQNEGINQMTINVDIPHYTTSKDPLLHREEHAYYGHMSTVPTHQFFKQNGKRSFIISRSNSVGSGHIAGHWTGDNVANWQFLRASINGNFLFQIFGIQMVGSDICGFYRDTTEQLCSRWMQLGAFYPFSRNHNHNQARSQQPYSFGKSLLETSRQSLKTRYAMLKHMYTVMVNKKGKGSFFRPLTFEFFNDQGAYEQKFLETQFLIGKSLMIAPIVEAGMSFREVYFPSEKQLWYSIKVDSRTGKMKTDHFKSFKGGSKSNIDNPLPDSPPIFLRAGYGLLTNQPTNRAAKLNNKFHLTTILKQNQSSAQIMSIADYDNEPDISTCIQEGCFINITIKKIQQGGFNFVWKYQGNGAVRKQIQIESICLIEDDKKWSYNTALNIQNAEGSLSLKMDQIK